MSTLERLVTMHAYCRPAGSAAERAFIARYIAPLGAVEDIHGNFHLVIGDNPRHVWSSHTDTVHRWSGSQRVTLAADGELSAKAPHVVGYRPWKGKMCPIMSDAGSCLGADDTAGVWLMCELVRRGIAGRYVWHFGEEMGCIGSRGLVADPLDWIIDGTDMVIALDRKDCGDVITHQMGQRTASDAFAAALADQLNASHGLRYRPSDRGLYTDSKSYCGYVPECTNLSIGYAGNHSSRETLDTRHALRLLDALSVLDIGALPIVRNPQEPDPDAVAWRALMAEYADDDVTLPVVRPSMVDSTDYDTVADPNRHRTANWCYDCGEPVSAFQQICYNCGCDDPADTVDRADYLDATYARVQAALQHDIPARRRMVRA